MALLTNQTTDTTGTGEAKTGPCSVFARGTFDGATVVIQVSDDNTNYVKADNVSVTKASRFSSPGVCGIDCQGSYYIRAVLENAGSSTSVSVVATQ